MTDDAARAWRAQVALDPEIAYLNTGSYGLLPRPVLAVVTALREELYRNPVDFLWRRFGPRLESARERLAGFLAAPPHRLFFALNVSEAINWVAASLRLAAPGEIVLTDHEYGAMRWVWERCAARCGLTLRTLVVPMHATTREEVVAELARQWRPATRLFFFSHVLHTTGMVLPAAELCAAARRQGIVTVVDGAHAPGMIPLHLEQIAADYYCANLHKWLLAPLGAGFLYCTAGREELLQPTHVSWGWHYDRSRAEARDGHGGTFRQRAFEFVGSRDLSPWLAVPAAIDFHQAVGPGNIRARHLELSDQVRARLEVVPGVICVTPQAPELRGGLTAFRLPPHDATTVRRLLWERHRIEINLVDHPAGPWLRVSTHFYNLPEEIERLGQALPEALPAGMIASPDPHHGPAAFQ